MKIELPWPPSVNHYWRMGQKSMKISTAGIAYRELVGKLLLEQGITRRFTGKQRLGIEITAWPPDRRIRDLDNVLKVPLDSLQAARLCVNDSQFNHILIRKGGEVWDDLIELTLGREPQ